MEKISYNSRRYTISEVETHDFYQLPKFLFCYQELDNMSLAAKVLYAFMRDRFSLSLKNNWVDKNGNIYIIYSRKEMMESLHCKDGKIRKIIEELKKYELFEEERQGLSKPNLIYLTHIVKDDYTKKETKSNLGNQNLENRQSRVAKIDSQKPRKSSPNYNNFNNNKTNYNKSIYPSITVGTTEDKIHNVEDLKEQNDRMIDINAEIKKIKSQIEYKTFLSNHICKETGKVDVFYVNDFLNPIISIMLEVKASNGEYKIQGINIPSQVVQQIFEKLEYNDIETVIENIRNSENQITNMKAYIISSLYSQVLSTGFKEDLDYNLNKYD